MYIFIRIALMRTAKFQRTLIGLIVSIFNITNVISSNPGSTYELLRGWQRSSVCKNSFHKRWARIISTSSTSSVFLSDVRVVVNRQQKEIIVIAGATSGCGDGLASSNANESSRIQRLCFRIVCRSSIQQS